MTLNSKFNDSHIQKLHIAANVLYGNQISLVVFKHLGNIEGRHCQRKWFKSSLLGALLFLDNVTILEPFSV